MFKGKKVLIAYVIAGFSAIYAYVIQKLIELNWFSNVGFPTLVIYVFFMILVPILIYNIIVVLTKPTE